MQVALHFGAPYTDEHRLQLCLGKNRDVLAEAGTHIPRPSSFRKSLRPVLTRAQDANDLTEIRDEFLGEIMAGVSANRVVLSIDSFLGIPRLAIGDNQFFPGPFRRLSSFIRMFEGHQVELFYGIRNPATFMQNLLRDYQDTDLNTLVGQSDPAQLYWSEFFERVLAECPGVPLTVWCNEDTPMIWDEIVRDVAGVDTRAKLEGTFDLLKEIMTEEGYKRFIEYIDGRPNLTTQQRRRVVNAFLDKFVDDEALEEEVDMPGFTEEVLEHLTQLYDEDVDRIQTMPGIDFIEP